jgi:hypothetical protein
MNDLAQLEMTSGNYCHEWHERVKNAQNIFYGVQSGSSEYVDPTFPREDMIRDDVNPSFNPGGSNLVNIENTARWVDSIDVLYQEPEYSLFGSNGIRADDIFQGQIGNCWFMHGASAVANRAGRLERLFLNDSLSSNGIYGFQFYVLGVPTTLTIDDSLPLDEAGRGVFARVSNDGALWGPLLEKAFAKLHGTYEAIISGDPISSIEILSGAPASRTQHDSANPAQALELFELIRAALPLQSMVSASTPESSNGDEDRSALGLAQQHVYTVLGAFEAQKANGQTVQLYKIRNPWGREDYNGPFGDNDTTNWDPTLQAAVGYLDENDGSFFIDAATYHAEFASTTVHVDTTDMKQSYFLVTNDNTTRTAEGPFCGFNNCQSAYHKFTVKSEEDQTVYLSTHTWPIRSYPRSCVVEGNQYAGPGAARHYTRFADKNDSNTRYTGDRTWWTYGESIGLDGFEMAAGAELEVIMEMDWTENASKDFSLVFWGTGT